MIFRPGYIIRSSLNLYLFFILYLFLLLAIISSNGLTLLILVVFFFILTLLLISSRLFIYKYGEKIEVAKKYINVKKFFISPQVFYLSEIKQILVVKLNKRYGSAYYFVTNTNLDSKGEIMLTENNYFTLEGGWSDKEITNVLNYMKYNFKKIKEARFLKDSFWHVGGSLRRNFF